MNPSEQKKWFVYINDHHEGPFTVIEMRDLKERGQIRPESYVWCEGMGDWESLANFSELMSALEFRVRNSETRLNMETLPSKNANFGQNTNHSNSNQDTITMQSNPAPAESNVAATSAPKLLDSSSKKNSSKNKMPVVVTAGIFAFLILALVGVVLSSRFAPESIHGKLRPLYSAIAAKIPAIAPFIHLVPSLNDIAPEDKKRLESALLTNPAEEVKVAIALSRSDLSKPIFYITSNLPNGTKLQISIVGDGDTLLNELSFATGHVVKVLNGFARSDVFLGSGGNLIPKGEYQILVYETADQEEFNKVELAKFPSTQSGERNASIPSTARFVFAAKEFLGGEKDENYLTRLRAFHEKVKEAANKEAAELSQYAETMKSAFEDMREKFRVVLNSKKPGALVKKNWQNSYELNSKLLAQIDQSAQAWSDEMMNSEFFYGSAYRQVKACLVVLKKYSDQLRAYVETPSDKDSFVIQIGQTITEVEQALTGLRSKLDQVQNSPKTAAGLPTRLPQ